MAKIEIDENEYAELKRVADVARTIGSNPKAREMLQQAVAIAAPDQAGPEIRIRQEMTEKLSGIEKLLADDRAERAKEREERQAEDAKRALEMRWLEGRKVARESGYTDEGLEKLEAFMEREGVPSHKIAMAAFERENPPEVPVASGGSHWNFFDKATTDAPDFKALLTGDDESFLATAVPNALKLARGA